MKARNSFLQYPDIAPEAVEWLQLNLTDLRSITQLAEEVKKRVSSLDILGRSLASMQST